LASSTKRSFSALLCGLDKSARINRFGHPASNACVQAQAKDAAAAAAYMTGARTRAGSLAWS
jgi:hypothetical protein